MSRDIFKRVSHANIIFARGRTLQHKRNSAKGVIVWWWACDKGWAKTSNPDVNFHYVISLLVYACLAGSLILAVRNPIFCMPRCNLKEGLFVFIPKWSLFTSYNWQTAVDHRVPSTESRTRDPRSIQTGTYAIIQCQPSLLHTFAFSPSEVIRATTSSSSTNRSVLYTNLYKNQKTEQLLHFDFPTKYVELTPFVQYLKRQPV